MDAWGASLHPPDVQILWSWRVVILVLLGRSSIDHCNNAKHTEFFLLTAMEYITLCLSLLDLPVAEQVDCSVQVLLCSLPLIARVTVSDHSLEPIFSMGDILYAVAQPFENDTLCFVEMPDGTDKICNVRIEGEEYVLTCLDHHIPEERVSIHDIDVPMKIVGKDLPAEYK